MKHFYENPYNREQFSQKDSFIDVWQDPLLFRFITTQTFLHKQRGLGGYQHQPIFGSNWNLHNFGKIVHKFH